MTHRRAGVWCSAAAQLGYEQVREHAGEPGAGAEHDPVGGADGGHAGSHARRILRQQPDADDPPRRRRDRHLAADDGDLGRVRRGRCPRPSPRCREARPPSAAPGRARRAAGPPSPAPETVSPSRSQSVTMSRLPRAWLCSVPALANRCCSTSRHSRPHSPSSHSADSAIRRSPGGSTPSSRRSRPDEPPSSATVTTAVSRSVRWRSAASDADRPWPPPRATTAGPAGTVTVTPGRGRGAGWWPRCRGRAASRRTPRPWPPSGACRRCSRSRSWRSACSPARSR